MKVRNQKKTKQELHDSATNHLYKALQTMQHIPAWLELADPDDEIAAIQNIRHLYRDVNQAVRAAYALTQRADRA